MSPVKRILRPRQDLSRRYGVDLGRRVHLDDVELLEGLVEARVSRESCGSVIVGQVPSIHVDPD
jgi:hypothetical protein